MPRREPERTCIVTRETRPPADLIRFVLAPDGQVVPDLKRRLPGRGVWTGATARLVEEAVRRRLFARAFKAEVAAAPTLAEEIDRALLTDLRGALSLANKAGAVTSGFTKVEAAIGKGEVVAVIQAHEAAPDGCRKLQAALRRQAGGTISDIPTIKELSGDELDMALGRVHVIHAALLKGGGSDGCLARWRRLRAYRGNGETAEIAATGCAEDDAPAVVGGTTGPGQGPSGRIE